MESNVTTVLREATHHYVLLDGARVFATLLVPEETQGLVVMPRGAAGHTYSDVDTKIAAGLRQRGLATLEIDLLSSDELAHDAETSALRFDIGFLARRLSRTLHWTEYHPTVATLPLGIFASGTTAAAALVASAAEPHRVRTLVCRSARTELAGPTLRHVEADTLLIVGGWDLCNVTSERAALTMLPRSAQLALVPEGLHLLERASDIDYVIDRAAKWFQRSFGERRVDDESADDERFHVVAPMHVLAAV